MNAKEQLYRHGLLSAAEQLGTVRHQEALLCCAVAKSWGRQHLELLHVYKPHLFHANNLLPTPLPAKPLKIRLFVRIAIVCAPAIRSVSNASTPMWTLTRHIQWRIYENAASQEHWEGRCGRVVKWRREGEVRRERWDGRKGEWRMVRRWRRGWGGGGEGEEVRALEYGVKGTPRTNDISWVSRLLTPLVPEHTGTALVFDWHTHTQAGLHWNLLGWLAWGEGGG